jgi:outer membrane protein assembly factor BamD
LIGVAALLLLNAACGPRFETMTAQSIYEYGQARYAKGKYQESIEAWEKLIDLYPFSVHVTDAELGVADAHFKKRQYAEAEAAYDAFAKRHPTHEKADHVLYMTGMCGYKQKMAIDRDQTATIKAESSFSQVVSRYPNSTYYTDARLKLKEVRNDLAKRERYVAKFYWRDKEYFAALKRYERIIQLYADTDYYEEALFFGGRCLIYLDERDQARRYLEVLLQRFPEGKYAGDAKKLLAENP